jgi:hypothetical protein
MSNHAAQVPGLIADYFHINPNGSDGHPVIAEQFRPGHGWTSYPIRKRVTLAWLRKMKAEGATTITVRHDARVADFTIAEVTRYANRPLLGGRVI